MPRSGLTPEAMASAMDSGSATTATTMPETMSLGIWRRSSSGLECLMTLKRIGLILSCCMGLVSSRLNMELVGCRREPEI